MQACRGRSCVLSSESYVRKFNLRPISIGYSGHVEREQVVLSNTISAFRREVLTNYSTLCFIELRGEWQLYLPKRNTRTSPLSRKKRKLLHSLLPSSTATFTFVHRYQDIQQIRKRAFRIFKISVP